MASDALSDVLSLGSKEQHQRIDKLRELGVAEDINLPQLVVVGDQSSGKSSLLEGLTDLPFPTAADVCTRFATRIVFRRVAQPDDTTSLSIIPGPRASSSHKEALGSFSTDFAGRLTRSNFKDAISKAGVYMGLATSDDETTSPVNGRLKFSNDILNIEVSGPQQLQLSIIDLPGLFHHETKSQSGLDKELVQGLVEDFIKDSRTIILAVFNATVNLALQEVFTIAKRVDPQGLRTVGVMTHCDAVQKTAETQPVKIALNKVEKLHHGWYCVRNRTPEEVISGATIQARNESEQRFFEQSREWSAVSESRRGIKSLRKALYYLLSEHIAKEFPMIQTEVNAKLENARNELDGLGPSRKGDREQTQYLVKLAVAYQQFVLDSLSGRYPVHAKESSKLRTLVQNSNDHFNNTMHKNGCYISFGSPSSSPSVNNPFGETSKQKDVKPFASSSSLSPGQGVSNLKSPFGIPEDKLPEKFIYSSPEENKLADHERLKSKTDVGAKKEPSVLASDNPFVEPPLSSSPFSHLALKESKGSGSVNSSEFAPKQPSLFGGFGTSNSAFGDTSKQPTLFGASTAFGNTSKQPSMFDTSASSGDTPRQTSLFGGAQNTAIDPSKGNIGFFGTPPKPTPFGSSFKTTVNGSANQSTNNGFSTAFSKAKLSGGAPPGSAHGSLGSRGATSDTVDDAADSGLKLDIYEYIRTNYKESRGTELPGHVNPSLLERLFSEQSRKWRTISAMHVTHVWQSISVCHNDLISEICKSDITTRDRLAQSFTQEWDTSILRAMGVLVRLLEDERNGPLLTRNDEFAQNLSTARTERIFSRLKTLGFQDGASVTINFQQLASLVHLSNEDFTIYDVHDTLKAYYDVAVKRFIDNVVTQVVERTLLGSDGPLGLFNTDWVTSLSSSERTSLAEEDYATKCRREELTVQIKRLGQASLICSGKDDRP